MKQSIPILTVLVVIGTSAFAQQQAPNWLKVTGRAAWEPRDSQGEVVYKDQLWIFGGGSYLPNYHAVNDVWCTEDGVHWTKVTDAAPWHPRLWFASVVYRDRMRVLGGWWNNPSKNWGDVWYSEDGENWDELKSNVTWKERHEHSAFVFRENIWIAGGHARPLSNEVWSLDIPKGWFQKDRRID